MFQALKIRSCTTKHDDKLICQSVVFDLKINPFGSSFIEKKIMMMMLSHHCNLGRLEGHVSYNKRTTSFSVIMIGALRK